ncbi:sigma-70 family RNA polymerase sigma factor [Hutsoniella sourekii]|uniref:sigma-70 family RNA polymerase sigma factor n=1 Tax=Hutsoniella sourekii TaxID=87650 RepID=UPI000487445E|nr:sigma-70 family RNA polymerase sigma factor [Hutsoniella sourekii]
MREEWYREILDQFEPLLHKTLNSLGIYGYHPDRDDYLQELRLKLIDLALSFQGDLKDLDVARQFVAYSQRGLRWHLIDLLRQDEPDRVDLTSEVLDHLPFPEASDYLERDLLDQLRLILNDTEFNIAQLIVQDQLTMGQIADRLAMTRQGLHKHRQNIQAKLAPYKDFLLIP